MLSRERAMEDYSRRPKSEPCGTSQFLHTVFDFLQLCMLAQELRQFVSKNQKFIWCFFFNPFMSVYILKHRKVAIEFFWTVEKRRELIRFSKLQTRIFVSEYMSSNFSRFSCFTPLQRQKNCCFLSVNPKNQLWKILFRKRAGDPNQDPAGHLIIFVSCIWFLMSLNVIVFVHELRHFLMISLEKSAVLFENPLVLNIAKLQQNFFRHFYCGKKN